MFTEIEYLGHTLTPNGVKPNDTKVKAVQEFPQLKSAQDIQSFLGLRLRYTDRLSIKKNIT